MQERDPREPIYDGTEIRILTDEYYIGELMTILGVGREEAEQLLSSNAGELYRKQIHLRERLIAKLSTKHGEERDKRRGRR